MAPTGESDLPPQTAAGDSGGGFRAPEPRKPAHPPKSSDGQPRTEQQRVDGDDEEVEDAPKRTNSRPAPLPPPKFGEPPAARPPTGSGAEAARAAALVAARAAQHAVPAQRERMVMEAAANVSSGWRTTCGLPGPHGNLQFVESAADPTYSAFVQALAAQREQQARAEAAAAPGAGQPPEQAGGAPRLPGVYTPPAWGGLPRGIPYQMEIMKDGAIVETLDLSQKDHYTFGRAPTNDVVLDHPSCSRSVLLPWVGGGLGCEHRVVLGAGGAREGAAGH